MIGIFQVCTPDDSGAIYVAATKDMDSTAMHLASLFPQGIRRLARLDGGKAEADELRKELQLNFKSKIDVEGWFVSSKAMIWFILDLVRNDTTGLIDVDPITSSALQRLADVEKISKIDYFEKYVVPVIREEYRTHFSR